MNPTVLRSSLVLAALIAALAASAQNLVQDPGFESAPTNGVFAPGQTVDGGSWTASTLYLDGDPAQPLTGSAYIVGAPFGYQISGDKSVVLSSIVLTQTLATLAGRTYTVSFDAYHLGSTSFPDAYRFTSSFGGSTNAYVSPEGDTHDGGTASGAGSFSYLVTATGASTDLTFASSPVGDLTLDNVSVTLNPVPEHTTMVALGLGAVAMLRRRKRA